MAGCGLIKTKDTQKVHQNRRSVVLPNWILPLPCVGLTLMAEPNSQLKPLLPLKSCQVTPGPSHEEYLLSVQATAPAICIQHTSIVRSFVFET